MASKPTTQPKTIRFSLPARARSVRAGRRPPSPVPHLAARIALQRARANWRKVIDRSKALLSIPDDWRLAVVPGSDTGAVEMALWSMLGARGVDSLVWESFGKTLGDGPQIPPEARQCPHH